MARFTLEVMFRGVICFLQVEDYVLAVLTDLRNPENVDVAGLKPGDLSSHHPKLMLPRDKYNGPHHKCLSNMDDSIAQIVEYKCISIADRYVSFSGVTKTDVTISNLNLPNISSLVANTGSPEHYRLSSGIDRYAKQGHSRMAAGLRIDFGASLGVDPFGTPRFAWTGDSIQVAKQVILKDQVDSIVNIHLIDPYTKEVEEIPVTGAQDEIVQLVIENGEDRRPGELAAKGPLDFLGHYHILSTPTLLTKLPFPLEDPDGDVDAPGPASNAQCSPAKHDNGG